MAIFILGKMMQDVRNHKLMSQKDLAEKSIVGIATIKRIEKRSEPYSCRNHVAVRLAAALGVELEDLTTDNFERIVDIGGDIELHIDENSTGENFMEESTRIAKIIDFRSRVLRR